MSDLISRKEAVDAVNAYLGLSAVSRTIQNMTSIQEILENLPSIEPETPSNGSITCVKSEKMHDRTMGDLISRQEAKDAIDMALDHIDHVPPWVYDKLLNVLNEVPSAEKAQLSKEGTTFDIPSAEPERLTDDDFETIRIHLNAYKENLCNQQRWEEAEEYQRIIDRFMAFASAQPEIIRCGQCKYAEATDSEDNQDGYTCQFHRGSIWFSGSYCSWAERREECTP